MLILCYIWVVHGALFSLNQQKEESMQATSLWLFLTIINDLYRLLIGQDHYDY